MDLPKTESEIELYFMLIDMKYYFDKSKENYAYMNDHIKATNLSAYNTLKEEYLKKVNKWS